MSTVCMWLAVVAVVAVVAGLASPTAGARACGHTAPLPTVPDLDLQRYAGVWFKVNMSRFIFDVAQRGLTCIRVNTPPASPVLGHATYNITEWSHKDGSAEKHVEHATIAQVNGSQFELTQAVAEWYHVPYDVLHVETDASGNYTASVVSTCAVHLGGVGVPGVWVMSRGYTLPPETHSRILAKLAALGFRLDELDLLPVEQGPACGW